jgi:hypothetical protein
MHSKNKVQHTVLADFFLKVHDTTKISVTVTTLTSENQGLYTPNIKAHFFFPYPHIPNPHPTANYIHTHFCTTPPPGMAFTEITVVSLTFTVQQLRAIHSQPEILNLNAHTKVHICILTKHNNAV